MTSAATVGAFIGYDLFDRPVIRLRPVRRALQ